MSSHIGLNLGDFNHSRLNMVLQGLVLLNDLLLAL